MFLNNHTYLRERTIQISMKSISNNSSFNLVCPRCFLIIFIVLAKIKTVFKSFNVNVVKDNGLLRVLLNQDLITIRIHLVLDVVKQPSYITTISFIHTSLVLTRDVIIISLCLKLVEIPNTSSSSIDLEKFTIKRMRHPFHIVFTALTLYFFDNSTLRKISQHLELVCEVKVSHVTISNWCKRFAPALLNALVLTKTA